MWFAVHPGAGNIASEKEKGKMNKKKMMEEILEENRQINRNLLHLGNMSGILILLECLKEAKQKRDRSALKLAKIGLLLTAITEMLFLLTNLSACFEKAREAREEEADEL